MRAFSRLFAWQCLFYAVWLWDARGGQRHRARHTKHPAEEPARREYLSGRVVLARLRARI